MPDGTWIALNYRSQSPLRLRHRDQRSEWARVQGLKVKDVENFVRRKRREKARESLAEELTQARALLLENGYNVFGPKESP
jgi:hypothetical protein